MKRMKSLFYLSVVPSFLMMVFFGTVHGGSVTMQREAGLQTSQKSAVTKGDAVTDKASAPLTFSPLRLKNKIDSGGESADSRTVKRERYKPYQQGEGESKTR